MVNGINSDVNALQVLRATQAFKKIVQSSQKLNSAIEDTGVNEIQDKVSISSFSGKTQTESTTASVKTENPILSQRKEYVNEIKQFASKLGNDEITDDDISYALKYGRSILVDRTA